MRCSQRTVLALVAVVATLDIFATTTTNSVLLSVDALSIPRPRAAAKKPAPRSAPATSILKAAAASGEASEGGPSSGTGTATIPNEVL